MGADRKSLSGEPFIPTWLDDARLSPVDFRVLCHLWRRRNVKTGQCNPSARLIADVCGMHRKTVFATLARLETAGHLKRAGKPFGGSNRYVLVVPSIVPLEGTIEAPSIVPLECTPIVPLEGTSIVPLEGTQRVTREGTQVKGESAPSPQMASPFSLTEQDCADVARDCSITPESAPEAARL